MKYSTECDMREIKKELYKIFSNKLIYLILILIIVVPFVCAFVTYYKKITYEDYWLQYFDIVKYDDKDLYLKEIERIKETIVKFKEDLEKGLISYSQYKNWVLISNKRIAIYNYLINNNVDYLTTVPAAGIFNTLNPDNSLYFSNLYLSSVMMTSTVAISFFSATVLNTIEYSSGVTKYIYQGSLKKRGKTQNKKLYSILILIAIIFLYDISLLFIFKIPFDDSIKNLLLIDNNMNISIMSSTSIMFIMFISIAFEMLFSFAIIFSLSRLIPNTFACILAQIAFFVIFYEIPSRVYNNVLSILTKPFFNLFISDFYTITDLIINICFKLTLAVAFFFLSSLYLKKKDL